MSKITSKYQISIPRALADRAGVKPGDEVEWAISGETLRIAPARSHARLSAKERLAMFDAATKRLEALHRGQRPGKSAARGWTREDLYDRGRRSR